MNVDQLGRDAAQAAHDAAREMPLRPIARVERQARRRTLSAALGGLGVAVLAIVLAVSVVGPSDEAPVATTPTTVSPVEAPTATAPTTSTTAAPAPTPTEPTPGPAPLPPVVPAGGVTDPVVWFDGFFVGTGAPGREPVLLTESEGSNFGLKMIADDRAGGFVTLADERTLLWWSAGAGEPQRVSVDLGDARMSATEVLDVVPAASGPLVDLHVNFDDPTADQACQSLRALVDLATGAVVRGVEAAGEILPLGLESGWITADCFSLGRAKVESGLLARLVVPELTDVDPESGVPRAPVPTSQVVITDQTGAEVATFDVTTDDQPWAVLHDFDGHRVLVSREAWEPALPARTFFLIDLDCVECGLGEPFTTGSAASADIATPPTDAVEEAPAVLSGPGSAACEQMMQSPVDTSPIPPPGLPDGMSDQWLAMFTAALNCDFDALDGITPEDPFISHLAPPVPGWRGAAELRPPLLLQVVDALGHAPAERDGVWYFPGFMSGQPWDRLAAEHQAEAQRVLGRAWPGASSGYATFADWFDADEHLYEYPSVIVEFFPDGSVRVSAVLS